ncbi:MAG: hypothetical protein U9R25_05745 [Chloroflexota bacterium]|nr:hypothetical protein [Chloroflexota bacterium]
MSFPLSYKPDGYYVLERLRRLYEDRDQEIILASMEIPSVALQEMAVTHPEGMCKYPDPLERARYWDARYLEKIDVRDDSIPGGYLSEMDQGLYGGLVGGQVRFLCDPDSGWISSMVVPILEDWSQFDQLAPFDPRDPHNEWLQRYLRQLDIFLQESRGKWGISHFILIDSLLFAYELMGATETYYGVIDHPEMMKRVIDYAFDLNVKVQNLFFDRAPLLDGGTISNFAGWIPGGRIVSESIDAFHMTSVDYFEEWGREPVERILAAFDGGVLHIHSNGRRLLQAASTLKGLRAIALTDEEGHPPAYEILDQVKKQTGDMPLIVYTVGFGEFCKALEKHRLPGGVFYHVKDVPDVDTANRCMDLVREYKP